MRSTFIAIRKILMIVLFLQFLSLPAVAAKDAIEIRFVSEGEVPLGGIVIDVYEATPVAEYGGAPVAFTEKPVFGMMTDRNGIARFERPSAYCSVVIRPASLPAGCTAAIQTVFFPPEKTEHEFVLSWEIPPAGWEAPENWMEKGSSVPSGGQRVEPAAGAKRVVREAGVLPGPKEITERPSAEKGSEESRGSVTILILAVLFAAGAATSACIAVKKRRQG